MDTSHTWHPGAICLAPVWTIPVNLLPDELLSSWLIRSALENGCDPLNLTSALWPERRIWTTDIDRSIPAACQASLAKMAGVSDTAIFASMLKDVASHIRSDNLPMHGSWPWILAVRARNRKRGGGLQFCSHCLQSDRRPYFRLQWRFAWHVICESHNCPLLDQCPHCFATVEPHRLTAQSLHQAVCASCSGILTATSSTQIDPFTTDLQTKTDAALANGFTQYLGQQISVSEWFSVLDTWLNISRLAARRSSNAALRFLSTLGVAELPYPLERKWECYDTASRYAMFGSVARISSLDIDNLKDVMVEAGMTRQGLFPNGIPTLPVMQTIATALPERKTCSKRKKRTMCRTIKPQSNRVVEQRMWRLRARMEKIKRTGA